jgi:hypothetical protein
VAASGVFGVSAVFSDHEQMDGCIHRDPSRLMPS